MAILAECPRCHTKQSAKNKKRTASGCGQNLDTAKQSRRVKYWIRYRLPDGKQKTELVKGEDVSSYSIEDARAVHSKKIVQKREGKVFDRREDTKRTFQEDQA
jgi:hypothetical protein